MLRGCLLSAIHPYAGIIQIRFEGVISAYTRRHPLIIDCKGSDYFFNDHTFRVVFSFQVYVVDGISNKETTSSCLRN